MIIVWPNSTGCPSSTQISFTTPSYSDAMIKYGNDKPDLRNPLLINDITEIFTRDDVSFEIFKKYIVYYVIFSFINGRL